VRSLSPFLGLSFLSVIDKYKLSSYLPIIELIILFGVQGAFENISSALSASYAPTPRPWSMARKITSRRLTTKRTNW
jgi:hypothetical protein